MNKNITLNVDEKIVYDLKSNGIQRSKFFRQAYKAYKEGLWKYKYVTSKDDIQPNKN